MEMHYRTTRAAWEAGIKQELAWWRRYLAGEGLDWPGEFRARFDPDTLLQPHAARHLPPDVGFVPRILDCAAGPATTLGKIHTGQRVDLVAVDALAVAYSDLLAELGLVAPVPSRPGEVERLDEVVLTGSFDLVYMRFALDHCWDPAAALRQMVEAAKPGGTVLVEHYRDAELQELAGLRQWRLRPVENGLVIENSRTAIHVSEAVPGAVIDLEVTPDWLTLVLRAPLAG